MYAWKMGELWEHLYFLQERILLTGVIENGEWHSDREPYGVIHRVASNGVNKGCDQGCFFLWIGEKRICAH